MRGKLGRAALIARHLGVRHTCPVCRTPLRSFAQVHPDDLPGARCPRCDALHRHRHLWLFLQRELTPSGRLLHLAPEAGLERRLRRLPGVDYVSGDLDPGAAMLTLDLERLDLPDASFDWVLCSHVLEHVGDDRAAMRELRRVLRDGGTLVVQVPAYGATTDEDPAVTDPADRLARFGQADHVRLYGADVDDRLRAAGFGVERVVYRPPARERERYGLDYSGPAAGYNDADETWAVRVCRAGSVTAR